MLQLLLLDLAGGPARLVLVDLEDLWLEREPQNRPGTGPEEGNFRRLRLVDAARRGRSGRVRPDDEGDSMVENRVTSPEEAGS